MDDLVKICWRDKQSGVTGEHPATLERSEAERLLKYFACDKEREYWLEPA